VLRAFVRAVRLAKTDKALSTKTLVSRAGLEEAYAARAYDQLVEGWREDGRLATEEGMKKFFEMAIAAGDVDRAWPKSEYWDDRFVASFRDWAPK
jgi:NitT/TauT family transport system substrate-binding protein